MSTRSRVILALASLAMLLMYVTPIWRITLDAPQYPEGIGMYIKIHDITGIKPNDLHNINGLNHYIGMKAIVPETINELKMMPWIIGTLIVLGLLGAATGKRIILHLWVGLFLVVAIAGMIDFYLWEFDYGHNLNPHAAIKVPGMTYQPPVIGAKQLLNFTANSWPYVGGWVAFFSLATGMVLCYVEWGRNTMKRVGS